MEYYMIQREKLDGKTIYDVNRIENPNGETVCEPAVNVYKGNFMKGNNTGIPFTTIDNIAYFLRGGHKIATVQLLEDSQVCSYGNFSRANKVKIIDNVSIINWSRWNDAKFCMDSIEKNGLNLQHIPVPLRTPELCLAAVRQNGLALEFVRNQTPRICLEAVQQYGLSLYFVREQTEEICMAAVLKDPNSIKWVSKKTPEICKAAVSRDKFVFYLIKDPVEELSKFAEAHHGCKFFINKPNPEFHKFADS
jgi:hypothetical protein